MGCAITTIGVFVPRIMILAWWLNDPTRWAAVYDGPVLPLFGFIFFPWTCLWYTVCQPTGFDLLKLILLAFAFLADVATWASGRSPAASACRTAATGRRPNGAREGARRARERARERAL